MTPLRPQTSSQGCGRLRQHGFSLVELMVALMLGLIVIGGVSGVFLSNKQSYRSSQALAQIQENARIAFELLARDIRQAGLTGCGNLNRIANTLENGPNGSGTLAWYADFSNAAVGYDGNQDDPAVDFGTGSAERVAGTDSFHLLGAGASGLSVESHNPSSANFKLNESTSELGDGDIIVVCDPDHATITQITNYNNSNVTLVHNTGNGVANPGNCSKGLGYPTVCTTNGAAYEFGVNSQIAKLSANTWYIGNNPLGGRSLYQVGLGSATIGGTPTATTTAQEMVRNVTDMQITYHRNGNGAFLPASSLGSADWTAIDAISITLTLQGPEQFTGTDGLPLSRQMAVTTTLRNRVN